MLTKIIVVFILLLPVASFGATLNVGSGQTYATIGAAITASSSGDTIVIYPGTYNESELSPKSGVSNTTRTIVRGSDSSNKPIINAGANAGTSTAVFNINGVNYITLQDLDIRGGGGMENGGITIGRSSTSTYITITGCKISATNYSGGSCGTLGEYNPSHIRIVYEGAANNILIEKNEITGSCASGLKVNTTSSSSNNITIKNNYIHDVLNGIGIKWGTTTDKSVTIQYNDIRDCYSGSYRGIYLDQSYATVSHNIIDTCPIGIVFRDNFGGTYNTISHNTIYGNTTALSLRTGADNNTITNNILYSNNTVENYGTGNTLSNFTSNPLFTNAAGNDFTLQAGSSAKNTASDGTDYGANLTLVGINGGVVPVIQGCTLSGITR